MSADARIEFELSRPASQAELRPKPKSVERDKVPHGSKDQEIENIKRLLANISQRVDALKSK